MGITTQTTGLANGIPPHINEVKSYFRYMNVPDSEAEVFFFYYQGLDWRNESGTPLRDWVMAADQWVWNLEN
ncbi:hypothetical protein [Echinicola sp. 20G]|uniref:hypothetical protein n=1 Tax=Echinicola sp. 20G TaxID=2781961 RepID=UPI00190FC296|nr:hypothetical protein [Echinicola sp. 20G]